MARPNINKRIAKALNDDSGMASFVMNVLTPDYIQGSNIIDEDTFQFVSDFMKGYDIGSIKDSVKGITLKAFNSMKITGNDDEDFNNFLEALAKTIKTSNEVMDVIMDIHNCVLLERSDLDDVEIVRNINLNLAISAFDGFRGVPESNKDLSDIEPITNENKKGELKMTTVKTGKTITFGNGHTAKTVVTHNDEPEKVKAEIIGEAASESTDPNKTWDEDTRKMAETYLNEMRQYPQFKEYADSLTIDDVVEYQRVIKDGNMNDIHDYIMKVCNSDPEKSNALFALFMGSFAIELLNRVKDNVMNSPKPELEEGHNPKPKEVVKDEPKKSEPIRVESRPIVQTPIAKPVQQPKLQPTPQPKPVEKKNDRFDGYREEDHNGYYLHLKRIGLVD